MALSEKEKENRKIERFLNYIAEEYNADLKDVKEKYDEYLKTIREIGIDFTEKNFEYYFKLRLKHTKDEAYYLFFKFLNQ